VGYNGPTRKHKGKKIESQNQPKARKQQGNMTKTASYATKKPKENEKQHECLLRSIRLELKKESKRTS